MGWTRFAGSALALAGLAACSHAAPPTLPGASCASPKTAPAEVAETMREMYAALKTGDAQAFNAITTSNFFTFDAGKYFDTASLLALVKAAHDRGAVYDWSVADPKVELECNMALLTYTNNGSLTEAGATRPLSWLESATLVHDGQRWRIRFFHSTRVP